MSVYGQDVWSHTQGSTALHLAAPRGGTPLLSAVPSRDPGEQASGRCSVLGMDSHKDESFRSHGTSVGCSKSGEPWAVNSDAGKWSSPMCPAGDRQRGLEEEGEKQHGGSVRLTSPASQFSAPCPGKHRPTRAHVLRSSHTCARIGCCPRGHTEHNHTMMTFQPARSHKDVNIQACSHAGDNATQPGPLTPGRTSLSCTQPG